MVEALAHDPRPVQSKKMQGSECAYRIRIEDYRVIYEAYDERVFIEVVKVGNRRDVCRKK